MRGERERRHALHCTHACTFTCGEEEFGLRIKAPLPSHRRVAAKDQMLPTRLISDRGERPRDGSAKAQKSTLCMRAFMPRCGCSLS